MAKFVVRIYEIGAHDFTIDAPDEEAAVALARANFDAQVDAETYTSLGLAPGHPPSVAPATAAPNGGARADRTLRSVRLHLAPRQQKRSLH